MEAVVTHGFRSASVEEVPRPSPGPGEVLVQVDRVQVSVTEASLYRGEASVYHETVRDRIEADDGRLFGHEFCGRVVETGEAVTEFEAGDRVYAPGKTSCGTCPYCTDGYDEFCENPTTIGLQTPGAMAEYLAVSTEPLCALPDGVSDAEGAALQPFASAVACVHGTDLSTGDAVAVVGSGVMGAGCGQLALRHGAGEVYAVDVDPRKVALAEELGMVGVSGGGPVAAVREATGDVGADVVFEAVGGDQDRADEGEDPLARAFRTVRRGGQVVQVGILAGEVTVEPLAWRGKVVDWVNPNDIAGVVSTDPNADTGETAADLVADGRVAVEPFVTHELDGLDAFEAAVAITLGERETDALGPPQIVL